MSVADIEGASPSVAPQKVRNIKKGKEHLQMGELRDSLGQYEKLFSLKQIATGSLTNSALLSNSELQSPTKRYNPTYITTFALHY